MIVYFEGGEKRIFRTVFGTQGAAYDFAVANEMDSWHLVQLEVK
jgi:hypothetical protein